MNNRILTLMLISFFFVQCLWTQSTHPIEKPVGDGITLYPKHTLSPLKIDGVLDDPAWKDGPIIGEPFITNHPVYGEKLPQHTEIYLTYDHNNIYAAFYCHDPEPEKIKTSISRRDNIGTDDWVGIDLDAMGNRQCTYEHICNPNGTQYDLVNSVSGGENADPDWIWYSTGKLAEDGYIVEMQIPLKSLKFKSGHNVTLNLAFFRYISRTGTNASWPQIDQQKGYFNSLVPVVFEKLNPQLRLEALPAFTYGSIRDRISPLTWAKPEQSKQLGIGIKYGLTSSIDSEITLNPDFSQVESDEFQVLVNQRYPLFYSEKRSFFMGIQNQFNLAGLGVASGTINMSTAVHTRNIIDPAWGGKITGDLGKISAGILAAADEWPGKELDGSQNALLHQGKNANFLFGRLKYSFNGDNYAGLLYTRRKFGDDYNQVIGGDIRFRIKGNHNIS
ncbi:MAG: carbohydrate binding family 9 domain-containing protein, partial [Acidobacteria bacterium]|nr:carbohydrate binding family 9 domain-containing protein [Acidobacteriota bacterium]